MRDQEVILRLDEFLQTLLEETRRNSFRSQGDTIRAAEQRVYERVRKRLWDLIKAPSIL